MIVGVSGKIGSGKSFLGKLIIAEMAIRHRVLFQLLKFAGPVYQAVAASRGVSLAEIERRKDDYRADMQRIGRDGRRKNSDHWVMPWATSCHALRLLGFEGVLADDVRYPNEFAAIRKVNGFLIRIEAPLEKRRERAAVPESEDESETALDHLPVGAWDYVFFNNDSSVKLVEATARELADKIALRMKSDRRK